jgi:tripartite-type tricarboxylate transporter receptor subunit TctC
LAPPGTPKNIIAQINQALGRILRQPEVLERLRADGQDAVGSTPEEMSRAIARDIATWNKVVKAGNIKLD